VKEHYFPSVVWPCVWEILFKTRGKFTLGVCPRYQKWCCSGETAQ